MKISKTNRGFTNNPNYQNQVWLKQLNLVLRNKSNYYKQMESTETSLMIKKQHNLQKRLSPDMIIMEE